jgi:hypothetical protein
MCGPNCLRARTGTALSKPLFSLPHTTHVLGLGHHSSGRCHLASAGRCDSGAACRSAICQVGFGRFDGCNVISFFVAVRKNVFISNTCLIFLAIRQMGEAKWRGLPSLFSKALELGPSGTLILLTFRPLIFQFSIASNRPWAGFSRDHYIQRLLILRSATLLNKVSS